MRLVLAGIVLAAFAVNASAEDAKPYVSKSGKFKILFPDGAEPKASVGGMNKDRYVFQVETKQRFFDVTYFDFPDSVDAKTVFDAGEKGAVETAKVLCSLDGTFGRDKFPSREIAVRKDKVFVRVVMILADKRFYVLTVGGPEDFTTSKEAYAFFETFEITK